MSEKLTDLKIKSLKPKTKPYTVSDGTIGGLVVAVSTAGKKVFRLKFQFQGKAQQLTLGPYPELCLAEAREKALEAKKQLHRGTNPAAAKKAAKTKVQAGDATFRSVAGEWLLLQQAEWSPVHLDDTIKKLDKHVLPRFGDKPIAEVGKADIKAVLDTLQAQQKFPTLKKIRTIISQVLRYAIDIELPGVTVDWAAQLRSKQYRAPSVTHRAAITNPRDARRLMKAIDSYESISLLTCLALKFSALTFSRPGEIRRAEWAEIDWEAKLWRIPAEKMKMRKPHLVPLATQTIAILEQLMALSGHSTHLFPSSHAKERTMSEATITAALRRMGYTKEEMCAHGFRGMASTILNEHGFNRDWIEAQLAHGPQDKVRAAYNHSDFLNDRRDMMQWWADFLYISNKEVENDHNA